MLTIGSELTLTVDGISIEDGQVLMVCRDTAGALWQIAHQPAMGPVRPAKGLSLARPPAMATAIEALEPAAGPHSAPTEATTDPGRLAPVKPASPWSSVDDIATFIASSPRTILNFGQSMTLHKRRLVADRLLEIVGSHVRETRAFKDFVSVDPAPDLGKNAEKGQHTWGADDSAGRDVLGIANYATQHERTERQTVVVDEFLSAVEGQVEKRHETKAIASTFDKDVERWGGRG